MQKNIHRYFLLNKPVNMLSQFIGAKGKNCLANIDFDFPEGTYALGRLDKDSAGLLLLTTNPAIVKLLFNKTKKHKRTYIAQVAKIVSLQKVDQLKNGVPILIKGNEYWQTSPCEVCIIEEPLHLPQAKNLLSEFIPYSWLSITLTEGKYHQVRKMTRTVGHICKQLIRVQIAEIELGNLKAGEVKEISEQDFFIQLHLAI
jgi:23S rRNA pseudouridine2457 synthase